MHHVYLDGSFCCDCPATRSPGLVKFSSGLTMSFDIIVSDFGFPNKHVDYAKPVTFATGMEHVLA